MLEPGAGAEPRSSQGDVGATVRVLSTGPDTRRIEVDSPRDGWLVVLDSWATGWNATVNGRDEPIERGDFAFRAVRVPTGRSEVRMQYTTPGLRAGIAISTLGVIAALVLLLFPIVRRRRTTGRMAAA